VKKCCSVSFFCIIGIFAFIMSLPAGEVTPSKDGRLAGIFGEMYECAFPNDVVLDGNLNEYAWQYAPWHTIEHAEGTQPAPDGDDATCSFAVVADRQWLYVAFRVTDDEIVTGESVGDELWKDDSVEIYIDANNGKTATYEKDDSQITIGAVNMENGDIDDPELGGTGDGATTETRAAVVETDNGWIVEAAVPLSNSKWDIELKDSLIIGFNVHLNDDDDGGDRDHKLIWSLNDVDDQSWDNTQRFAELIFIELVYAVESCDKLSATWGQIKQH